MLRVWFALHLLSMLVIFAGCVGLRNRTKPIPTKRVHCKSDYTLASALTAKSTGKRICQIFAVVLSFIKVLHGFFVTSATQELLRKVHQQLRNILRVTMQDHKNPKTLS